MSEPIKRNRRKVFSGVVVSDKMHKTITVQSTEMVEHTQFKKYIRRHTKLKAHDEKNEARVGDFVEVTECRPLSKTKRYRLSRIVRRGPGRAAPTLELEGGAQ